jgi:hypothetical protein
LSASEAPDPGRHHVGTPGDIISECPGDFVGIRTRDVSEAISAKVRDVAAHEGREPTSGTLAFIEAHIGRVKSSQPCHCGE